MIVFYKNGSAGTSSSTFDTTKPVASAVLGDTTVSVPTWEYFKPGNLWSLVSAKHMLALNYAPTLVTTTVEHAPAATQVSKTAEAPLASLVAAAHSSGVELMLSSAYRSSTDQQTTYNELLARNGAGYVHEYVAAPGASEHQTGLAVDIASVTHGCDIDANACSLDADGITWLRAHAPTYGFIERYPSGKQPDYCAASDEQKNDNKDYAAFLHIVLVYSLDVTKRWQSVSGIVYLSIWLKNRQNQKKLK